MKRLLSLTLAAIFIASVLASCASPGQRAALDPKITVTSSDAVDAAAWLSERLGERLTDSVVLGTDADGYGVDLSALEDDGYYIRSFGREDVLFAKTADGLDRAVRKYAKTVESGAAVLDTVYHEGYRVKSIKFAGRDVSEYTVYCENEKYMLASANEFAERIKEACGASLPVSTGEAAAPYIAIRYADDESLSTVGYRWEVAEDGLIIECSAGYKPTSAHFGLTRFLVTQLD